MYFSINGKLKKVLSMILVLVMALSLFSGCMKKDASEDTQPSENSGLNIDLNDSTTPVVTPVGSDEPTQSTQPKSENMAKVTSRMNVRAKPAVDAVIVYTLEAGDEIEITRQEHVVGYDWGYTPSVPGGGWVVMDFVEMENKQNVPSNTQTPAASAGAELDPESVETPATNASNSNATSADISGTVTASELRIRSEASDSAKVVGSYKKGDKVTITETKGNWGKTSKGWVSMSYISTSGSSSSSTSTSTDTSSSSSATIQGNGSTSVVAKGVVKAGELNLRSKASTSGEKVGTLKYGARVEILETSGNWGRTSKGWVHMDYIYKDGTTGKNTDSGTVTGNELNIRSGPGTSYSSVGHYDAGDKVTILEKFTYGNTTWGCTNKGWISLTYVDLEGGNTSTGSSSSSSSVIGKTGTITAEELNIRQGAGSNYDAVGSYLKGETVTILETNGNWGRTDKGWISIRFVDFTGSSSSSSDTATITATELRIRAGAGTSYDVVGSYSYGDKVTILETKDGWGRTAYGWIDLDYVDYD